jgi:hypothetical protein
VLKQEADMKRLIEVEDFSPFGGAMDPYYRIQGRLIQAMNHKSEIKRRTVK